MSYIDLSLLIAAFVGAQIISSAIFGVFKFAGKQLMHAIKNEDK